MECKYSRHLSYAISNLNRKQLRFHLIVDSSFERIISLFREWIRICLGFQPEIRVDIISFQIVVLLVLDYTNANAQQSWSKKQSGQSQPADLHPRSQMWTKYILTTRSDNTRGTSPDCVPIRNSHPKREVDKDKKQMIKTELNQTK